MTGGKNKTGKDKNTPKRKNISPLSSDITRDKVQGGKTGFTSGQNKTRTQTQVSKQQKRFHTTTGLFNFDKVSEAFPVSKMTQNLTTGGNMSGINYPQPNFGAQYMQSPPFSSQFTPQFNSNVTSNATSAPAWATEIMEDIKLIKKSVSKIDSIEKTVNRINSKVDNLETKVKSIDSRVTEVEASCSFTSNEMDSTKKTMKSAQKEINEMKEKCSKFDENIKTFEAHTQKIDTKLDDLESRSMRENLLFYGIQENDNENCEALVLDLIKTHLDISSNISLDRVHRIGANKEKGTRPIVAKFHNYKDRELVRTTSYDKQEVLKPMNLGIGIQQTRATMDKRRPLYSVMNREKAAGNAVKWAGSKLLVRSSSGGKFQEMIN